MATHKTTDRDRAVIAKYLLEAHGKERQLETALKAQIVVARRPGVDHALREHLVVTREQIRAIERRLSDLGEAASTPGFSPTGAVIGLVSTIANKSLALAKGPLVIFRGTSPTDRELRMVRDCYWNEAEEIAHYRVIETLATELGDGATARLAKHHREQEEAMQTTLEGQLPAVIRAVVAQETPASEWPPAPEPTPRSSPGQPRPGTRRSTTASRRPSNGGSPSANSRRSASAKPRTS
jgi:ferritin-like metal-binding protein YciE